MTSSQQVGADDARARPATVAGLHHTDIRWTPKPLPALDTLTDSPDERLILAFAESAAWELLAKEAIAALSQLQRDHDRLRDRHHHLIEEYRSHRARTMREDAA